MINSTLVNTLFFCNFAAVNNNNLKTDYCNEENQFTAIFITVDVGVVHY